MGKYDDLKDLGQVLIPFLFCLKPETAHNLSIFALKHNLVPKNKVKNYSSLKSKIFNINFTNPIGLAAGYDKNADVFNNLNDFGFGFVEAGTVTPKAQEGNPKPRLFRLKKDKAVINRMGFNNKGADYFLKNVKNKQHPKQILGINIGKNKDVISHQPLADTNSRRTIGAPPCGDPHNKTNQDLFYCQNPVQDYLIGLEKLYQFASYITINISSPNTKNLRNIQKADILDQFLKEILKKKTQLAKKHKKQIPILLKIAPDLNEDEIKEIAKIVLKNKIDGAIISNTTIERKGLKSKFKNETGGLSGKPLFNKSNQTLKIFYQATKGQIPIIGVGGITNGKDAYEKIKLGASLVQLYSHLVYEGFNLVEKIKKELDDLLKADGFKNISQAVGVKNKIN